MAAMTKAGLLARIHHDRAKIEATWQGLSAEIINEHPGPEDNRSIKDMIAHITFWEQHGLQDVHLLLDGQDTYDLDDDEVHAINAQVFEQNRDRPLDDILNDWHESLRAIEAVLDHISDDDLNNTAKYANGRGHSILVHLIVDTYGHYADHLQDMRDYADKVRYR